MQATSKLNLSWSDEELNSPEVAKSLHMWWKVVIYYTLRSALFFAMFQIRNVVIRIRIRGSVPIVCRSGSCSFLQ
jgi:hypothetical protein